MNADNLELKSVSCFGFREKRNWQQMATNQKLSDAATSKLEASLKSDIDSCQDNLVIAYFNDVESEMQYKVSFENALKLWKLDVKDSPDAQIMAEDKKVFFGSEVWKLALRRVVEILERSKDTLENYVTPMLESGKLISVDEIKYSNVVSILNDAEVFKNLKLSKYVK